MPPQLVIHDCQTVPENLEGHTSSDSPKLVEIKYPRYPDITNILIAFTAYDSLDGGIHHETARIACGILCGNRWDGYLTETSDGPPLAISSAGVLPAGVYYFQVPPPPLVHADSKLLFTLLLASKGIFQAQISPGSIQLCRALIIGGFPTVIYPGCGCHHVHHRPPIVHNCTCQSAQMSPSPQC